MKHEIIQNNLLTLQIICTYAVLQDAFEENSDVEGVSSSSIMDINTISAILFVVVASCFLIMLYKLMSFWFIEVLVVLFCIGGVEVRTVSYFACLVSSKLMFTFSS